MTENEQKSAREPTEGHTMSDTRIKIDAWLDLVAREIVEEGWDEGKDDRDRAKLIAEAVGDSEWAIYSDKAAAFVDTLTSDQVDAAYEAATDRAKYDSYWLLVLAMAYCALEARLRKRVRELDDVTRCEVCGKVLLIVEYHRYLGADGAWYCDERDDATELHTFCQEHAPECC